jgi:hypothetical protein
VPGQARIFAEAEIACGTDVERYATRGQLGDQCGVLNDPNSMGNSLCAKGLHCGPDAGWPGNRAQVAAGLQMLCDAVLVSAQHLRQSHEREASAKDGSARTSSGSNESYALAVTETRLQPVAPSG